MGEETATVRVVHRDGTITGLDVGRIRAAVSWACEGTGANPVALESALEYRLRGEISTREIQGNLIDCAVNLCSPEQPEWRHVAGRLHVWGLWKDAAVARGLPRNVAVPYRFSEWRSWLKSGIYAGTHVDLFRWYGEDELREAYGWIVADRDRDFDYAGVTLFARRYLLDGELPQEALLSSALIQASAEAERDRTDVARRAYDAFSRRKLSMATPILAGIRIPGASLSSCFILTMDDDLKGIADTFKRAMLISRHGGGIGVNMSRVRAAGSSVGGQPNASGGVVPWINILDGIARAVNQCGRRAGAITVAIDVWHLDFHRFLELQTENGTQRTKAYDIFPQLVVNDEFMRRLEARREWTLADPYEVRTVLGIELATLWGDAFDEAYARVEAAADAGELKLWERHPALDLMKRIMRCQFETGLPYLAFKDAVNRANPNKHDGLIPSVNLCTESFSNVSDHLAHTCNLMSLNLANIEDDELPALCELAVRLLDDTIELTTPPIAESVAHNERYRTVGVGAMGLADWLAKRELGYSDLGVIGSLFEEIGYWTTRASADLASERGAYGAFPGSEWAKGNLIGCKPPSWYEERSKDPQRWLKLSEDIRKGGIRNSHITAIAPNTSSALVQGCTAGVLPAYGRFHIDQGGRGAVPVAPPFVKDKFWHYRENKSLDQRLVVGAVAEIQKWIDTGISMELTFNLNEGVYWPDRPERRLEVADVFEVLMSAWRSGLKTVYYIRTVQRDAFGRSDCSSCTN